VILCSSCGRSNEDHFSFCLGCGANLKKSTAASVAIGLTCAECGAAIPDGHGFCGKCGARVPEETASEDVVSESRESDAPDDGHTGARVVLINPDGSVGDTVPLKAGENVFGRETGPDVFREDPYLSPRHVCFSLHAGTLEVRDLESLNGIFYRILERTEVRHGDLIRLGRQLMRFEALDAMLLARSTKQGAESVLGAPRGEAWGRLSRISGPKDASFAFLLAGATVEIGRDRGDIVLNDDGFVSGSHARMSHEGGKYFLDDLRSSNGTFLKIRGTRLVKDGELLLMGQQPIRAYVGS